jgi:hypothetical protein
MGIIRNWAPRDWLARVLQSRDGLWLWKAIWLCGSFRLQAVMFPGATPMDGMLTAPQGPWFQMKEFPCLHQQPEAMPIAVKSMLIPPMAFNMQPGNPLCLGEQPISLCLSMIMLMLMGKHLVIHFRMASGKTATALLS